eukprot:2567754-Rhodomonas_salina.1
MWTMQSMGRSRRVVRRDEALEALEGHGDRAVVVPELDISLMSLHETARKEKTEDTKRIETKRNETKRVSPSNAVLYSAARRCHKWQRRP